MYPTSDIAGPKICAAIAPIPLNLWSQIEFDFGIENGEFFPYIFAAAGAHQEWLSDQSTRAGHDGESPLGQDLANLI